MTTATCETGPSRAELRLLMAAAAAASAAAVPATDGARQRADAVATTWLLPVALLIGLYDVVLLLVSLP